MLLVGRIRGRSSWTASGLTSGMHGMPVGHLRCCLLLFFILSTQYPMIHFMRSRKAEACFTFSIPFLSSCSLYGKTVQTGLIQRRVIQGCEVIQYKIVPSRSMPMSLHKKDAMHWNDSNSIVCDFL